VSLFARLRAAIARRRLTWLGALAAAALAVGAVALMEAASSRAEAKSACGRVNFDGAAFMVCRYDSYTDDLRLVWEGRDGRALRSFAALAGDLGRDGERVRFAMNAGMFNKDGGPIGLYIENGAQRHKINTADGPGNFHMKPNGVFSVDGDGAVHVETSEDYLARDPSPAWATQSGPMLVISAALHPALQEDGASHYVRNGVGRLNDHVAYFALSERAVSFGKLARLFRDKLKCRDALYFDGSVSSIWIPAAGRRDEGPELGPMVVVFRRR
jgi:uncharacterized protein YigE (DUF2233 family)